MSTVLLILELFAGLILIFGLGELIGRIFGLDKYLNDNQGDKKLDQHNGSDNYY
jgi:hypothetical protein